MSDPEVVDIRPQPGFQERAAACTADIAILGGSAGCGKSFMMVVEPLRNIDTPGFSAIIFRRESPSLRGPDSVWEEARGIYPHINGVMREHRMDCRFPSGATVNFSHLQYEADVNAHKSKGYALIIFEELTEFEGSQFWYMLSRNRSTCGVRPYLRATCNPDPDSFVRKLIDWWIDDDGLPIPERAGVIRWMVRGDDDEVAWGDSEEELRERFKHDPSKQPLSFTFIPGKLEDNQKLEQRDPDYRAKLALLPRVERERLLGGNWNVRAAAGDYFRRSDWETVKIVPGVIVQSARGWDRAASEPSEAYPDPAWTAGVKIAKLDDDRYIVLDVERFRERSGEVEKRIRNIGDQEPDTTIGLFQDPASAGKGELEAMARKLSGLSFESRPTSTTGGKEAHAVPFSAQVQHGNVLLLEGEWNEAYILELEAFSRKGSKKDQVDASSLAFELLQRTPLGVV